MIINLEMARCLKILLIWKDEASLELTPGHLRVNQSGQGLLANSGESWEKICASKFLKVTISTEYIMKQGQSWR